ncbi:putative anthocyanidin 3-O-glucoside 2''-O-glucosyltransferase [Lupinus albus]|uniref:Putative anthocyanidin 3-O-glucoside 2''-O-glucosyltransferase n=1 Tax=Lupinus albus TaxID=3870 RepID=A0A6A4P0L7_LUPAL|nr:putative anthocyanidin 3-O-glucoside 2''-O-glucosyltransferase [Lupinus albus]
MTVDLEVGVEVKKSEDGLFTRETMREAMTALMGNDSEVGHVVRFNHGKWREF